MAGLDVILSFEIGNGPGDLQNPRIGPGAQTKLVDGRLQQFLARFVDRAEPLDVAVGHLGITIDLHALETVKLDSSSPVNPLLDLG